MSLISKHYHGFGVVNIPKDMVETHDGIVRAFTKFFNYEEDITTYTYKTMVAYKKLYATYLYEENHKMMKAFTEYLLKELNVNARG